MPLTNAQLEDRRNYLGASDASKVLLNPDGVPFSPFGGPQDVYFSKIGPVDQKRSTSTDLGNWLEGPLIAYAEETLNMDIRTNTTWKPVGPFMAHPDGVMGDAPNEEGVECKVVGGAYSKDWGDPDDEKHGAPAYVQVQCQMQMYVCGFKRVRVPVAFMSNWSLERRLYTVVKDNDTIAMIVEHLAQWWQAHVVARVPPDPSQPSPMSLLRSLARDPEKTIEWDTKDLSLVVDWIELKLKAGEYGGKASCALRKLLDRLDDATVARLPDGREFRYAEERGGRKCDFDKLKALDSKIYDEVVSRSTRRVPRLG